MAFARYLFLALLFCSNVSASAANAILAELSTSNDPFTVLKTEFAGADKAQISDYPKVYHLNTANSPLECRFVCRGGFCNYPARILPGVVGQFDKFIPGTPGTPGNGPLFPGEPATPDRTVSLLTPILLSPNETDVLTNEYILTVFKNVSLETKTRSSGELVTEVSYIDQSGFPFQATTYFRKKGAQLFVREMTNLNSEAYGYCY